MSHFCRLIPAKAWSLLTWSMMWSTTIVFSWRDNSGYALEQNAYPDFRSVRIEVLMLCNLCCWLMYLNSPVQIIACKSLPKPKTQIFRTSFKTSVRPTGCFTICLQSMVSIILVVSVQFDMSIHAWGHFNESCGCFVASSPPRIRSSYTGVFM